MRVLFLKSESDHKACMWEIYDGDKWWVAVWSVVRGGWSITTGKQMREVKPTGALGRKIIEAVEASKKS